MNITADNPDEAQAFQDTINDDEFETESLAVMKETDNDVFGVVTLSAALVSSIYMYERNYISLCDIYILSLKSIGFLIKM